MACSATSKAAEFAAQQPLKIESGVVYPLGEAERILGWTRATTRIARRKGLQVMYSGRLAYVAGDEIIRYFQETSRTDR